MHALLIWPTYGAWLPGPARGGQVERLCHPPSALPAPDPALSASRGRSTKWPTVALNDRQQQELLDDLPRIAALRVFTLHAARASPDHVCVLFKMEPPPDDEHRLVQLVKGSLARTLSVAAGDPVARSPSGQPLLHQKWWARQYVLQVFDESAYVQSIIALLRRYEGAGTTRIYGETHPAA